MKIRLLLLIIVASATLFSSCSSKLVLREGIQSFYEKWNTHSQNKDYDNLFGMLHKDFKYIDEEGKVETKDSFTERVRTALTSSRNINYGTEIIELNENGNEVTTNIIYSIQMEYNNGNEWIPLNYKINSSETFIKENDDWLLLTSRVMK